MINETKFHAETATFRAVTGGAYNFPDAYGVIKAGTAFQTKGSIPQATAQSGTIISQGKNVRGTGTEFTKLNLGDFLYQKDVVRQITEIISDTLLVLKEAFPTDITVAVTPLVCKPQIFKKITAKSTHASTAATALQESPFRVGDEFISGGAPLSYDATAGEISFIVNK